MGIDVMLYRVRIGTFSMPRKCWTRLHGISVPGRTVSAVLRLVLFLSVLVVMGGDVELNPGPGRSQRHRNAEAETEATNTPTQNVSSGTYNDVLLNFMMEMKIDLKTDVSSINRKIDDINSSVNTLKQDNEKLKTENREIKEELETVRSQLDKLEGISRRNNLIFHGIPGEIGESWDVCEQKVREIIRDDLGLPTHEHVEIERAHRIGKRNRGDRNNGTQTSSVIVKFSRYKDKDSILSVARQTFNKDSQYRVQEDYTDRVKTARRELRKRLVEARETGQIASMRFDKLIIDNDVYMYDDKNEKILLIGPARRGMGNPPRGRGGRERRGEADQSDGREEARQNEDSESEGEAAGDVAQGGGDRITGEVD